MNSATITFPGYDDTLGNVLRAYLLEDEEIIFSAYKTPHPLKREVQLEVQTIDEPVLDRIDLAIERVLEKLEGLV